MRLIVLCLASHLFATQYVTTNIQGQLGNQLFQTAVAIAYALDHDYEARFPSLKNVIGAEDNLRYVFHRVNVSEFPNNVQFESFYEQVPEQFPVLPYDPDTNLCLHGYFPFEPYFSHHAKTIKELFAPTQELVDSICAKYGEILKQSPVAIHVRTFFSDSIDPNEGIGRTNWDYFVNAMEFFPEGTVFLIFSDAPDWVKLFFPQIREPMYFVEGNHHCFDFYLMSLCSHQILSPKSTFSWWAAWLNNNPDKIVIRPDNQWLPDEAYPASWRKISIQAID